MDPIPLLSDARTIERLHDALAAAGIPIDGLRLGPPVVVDFRPEATAAQRSQATAIVAGFDLRPRKPKPLPTLLDEIKALNGNKQRDLQLAMMASYLRDHPRLARTLGIPLDGDQPE